MPSESNLWNPLPGHTLDEFLIYFLSGTESVHIFPHRMSLDNSFGQNIINCHKIWAEYGVRERVWLMDDLLDPYVVKNHDLSWIWKPSWDLRNTRKHTPVPLDKHRSFASFAREVNFALVFSICCNRARHDFTIRELLVMLGYVHLQFVSIAAYTGFDYVMPLLLFVLIQLSLISLHLCLYCCNYQYYYY